MLLTAPYGRVSHPAARQCDQVPTLPRRTARRSSRPCIATVGRIRPDTKSSVLPTAMVRARITRNAALTTSGERPGRDFPLLICVAGACSSQKRKCCADGKVWPISTATVSTVFTPSVGVEVRSTPPPLQGHWSSPRSWISARRQRAWPSAPRVRNAATVPPSVLVVPRCQPVDLRDDLRLASPDLLREEVEALHRLRQREYLLM